MWTRGAASCCLNSLCPREPAEILGQHTNETARDHPCPDFAVLFPQGLARNLMDHLAEATGEDGERVLKDVLRYGTSALAAVRAGAVGAALRGVRTATPLAALSPAT